MHVLKRLLTGGSALLLAFAGFVTPAHAIDQAKPGENASAAAPTAAADEVDHAALAAKYAKQNRTPFELGINLDKLRLLGVQSSDQVKIMDSWARQSNRAIRHRQTIDGKDPLYTALDIAFRNEAWTDKNIIYVEAPPIRTLIVENVTSKAEATRIMESGLISKDLIAQPEVMQQLREAGNSATQTDAVNKVFNAAGMFVSLYNTLNMVPPPPDKSHDPWMHPEEIAKEFLTAKPGTPSTAPAARYTTAQQREITEAYGMLMVAWQENDVRTANTAIDKLAAVLPPINPEVYPSHAKAVTELWYNRTFSGTLVAIIYFAAMVLFFLIAVGIAKPVGRVAKFAFSIYGMALFFHLLGMGVRWWLNGRIPIQNQFESVMGAAALGCVLGFLLETRLMGKAAAFVLIPFGAAGILFGVLRTVVPALNWQISLGLAACTVPATIVLCSRYRLAGTIKEALSKISPGIFGTAFGFVGFLGATTLLAAPYVFGRDLGSDPGKVAGILDTYWLYIHVNIVIASYALIFATAVIGAIYLFMRQWHWINPIEPGFEDHPGNSGNDGGGKRSRGARSNAGTLAVGNAHALQITQQRTLALETLDQANMVVLQMAFWFLGVGIICGAIWADHSWGRPWGWDPKETFALVTWIVYLIIVHMRLVTKHKADWTAWLALAGCGVMLFNWIGVNFFLKGLHSYA